MLVDKQSAPKEGFKRDGEAPDRECVTKGNISNDANSRTAFVDSSWAIRRVDSPPIRKEDNALMVASIFPSYAQVVPPNHDQETRPQLNKDPTRGLHLLSRQVLWS